MKNYYEILQVNQNASQEIIAKVYKILTKKYHPDLYTGEEKKQAEEKQVQLNEAYSILSDPEKRKYYDLSLQENNVDYDKYITIQKENEYLKNELTKKNIILTELEKAFNLNINYFETTLKQKLEEKKYINDIQNNTKFTTKSNENKTIEKHKSLFFKITVSLLILLLGSLLIYLILMSYFNLINFNINSIF